jgi:chemotaxis protein CheZ
MADEQRKTGTDQDVEVVNPQVLPADYLPVLERAVEAARADSSDELRPLLDELTSLRERSLFLEIGRLTRQLHDALAEFQVDSRIAEVASSEFPDARDRLDQVIEMTERSAHRTMDLVETALPIADEMGRDTAELHREWQRFRQKELSADQFRTLVRHVSRHFELTEEHTQQLRSKLSEVLMAQDFQDLSGQEIRKVIKLVQEVEQTLLNMIKVAGEAGTDRKPESERAGDQKVKDTYMEARVTSQNEADDLLSSLGF